MQREIAWRDDQRRARGCSRPPSSRSARACIEDIDWRASRAAWTARLSPRWPAATGCATRSNLLITGATGCGKTWLACALAQQAARSGFSVLYTRAARLFDELQVAHGDGSFARRLAQLAKLDLLVIDDFAIAPIGAAERNDLLELLDDRVGTRSTLITSQLPVKAWHTYLDDPTLADAILDRIVHSSHKIELKGKSLRNRSRQDNDRFAQPRITDVAPRTRLTHRGGRSSQATPAAVDKPAPDNHQPTIAFGAVLPTPAMLAGVDNAGGFTAIVDA